MTERAANFLIHGHNNRVDVRGDITPFGVPGIAAGRMAFAAPPYGELRLFLLTRSPSQWILTNNVLAAFATCPEFRDVAVTVIPPGAIVAVHEGEWKLLPKHPPVNVQEVNQRIAALEHAVADVDTALRYEIRQIVARRRPLRLLLSGGVDSGLLASHLREEQADVVALTLRTPWGNEIEGAACTANHVGIPLEIIDLTAEELEAAIPRCMRLLQTSDAEIISIHLLITIAFELAAARGADLVTGLGSDLLNARSDVGMANTSSDIGERIRATSASGLMSTAEYDSGPQIFHPYWSPYMIHTQLSVPAALKKSEGIDKYYLRRLASYRLPHTTAYGEKVAIQEGSGLVQGLERHIGRALQDHCTRIWDQLVHNSTQDSEPAI
ncbi:asparagine synthase C-terminal domain-containing protein [Rhodococcus qingshengii]|uniref:asparagine synthase C-terminal domain-containing protein n=1 Tax=Rhodococcus qingshengii TaxID=334542 RepID=UPI00237CEF8D|nr:asparagine synthase C-terminal domain-containing protein [Rhodococcus qingshengii]WCT05866.1 asparagine synthase C-terminal domain-containing protein [Rhodococcus qingshengii]